LIEPKTPAQDAQNQFMGQSPIIVAHLSIKTCQQDRCEGSLRLNPAQYFKR
jgi:hypothetical protein